jgi:hypothetical protein
MRVGEGKNGRIYGQPLKTNSEFIRNVRRTVERMDIRTAITKPNGELQEMGEAHYIFHVVIYLKHSQGMCLRLLKSKLQCFRMM